jgi:hypothetical protein
MENDILKAMAKMRMWRTAFFGLIIFLAGIAIGISSILLVRPGRVEQTSAPEIASERMIRDIEHYLNLSQPQAEAIRPIIGKYLQQLQQVRMSVRPAIVSQLQSMNQEVSALLDARQKVIWQEHFNHLQMVLSDRPPIRTPGMMPAGPWMRPGPGGPRPQTQSQQEQHIPD